jgi:hypothetical protein
VGLKRTVLRFLERRNYAVIHLEALEREREAAGKILARLEEVEKAQESERDAAARTLARVQELEEEQDRTRARVRELAEERDTLARTLARLQEAERQREALAKAPERKQEPEAGAVPPAASADGPLVEDQRSAAAAEVHAQEMPYVAPPPGANDLQKYAGIFDGITPWSGIVPAGFTVDFLGTLTSKKFLEIWGYHPAYVDGSELSLPRPSLSDGANGEFWFEAADWVQAAREARGRYVMVTLGASFGYQAVGSYRALQLLNPMPYKFVAVEPIPENMEWVRSNMRDNGVDPDEQWLIQAAIGAGNEPAFFPVGSPGLGAQNCIETNEKAARARYLQEFVAQGQTEEALTNLLLHNTTGLQKDIIKGKNCLGEIRLVSTVTLQDVLGPLERVDLLECDLQTSEILVFPPFRPLLKRKVHRIHMGTHGKGIHRSLLQMFIDDGWEIVFSYEPESVYETVIGTFAVNDGILCLRNPDV